MIALPTLPPRRRLASESLDVGNAVILNYFDRPCSALVAVIVHRTASAIRCKYINQDDPQLKPFNAGRGLRISDDSIQHVTPIGFFGCELHYWRSPRSGQLFYTVEIVTETRATYADGKPRQWPDAPRSRPRRLWESILEEAARNAAATHPQTVN